MKIRNVSISRIKVKRGRRAVNRNKVAQIAESITTLGLLHPISVNRQYELVTGRHRLEAFKKLGRKTIPAITTEKGLKADLMEIDENLIRQELSVLERAENLQKRREIYEMLYEPIKGGPGRGHREKQRNNFVPFSEDAAKTIGSSRRTVENEIQIAKNISPAVKKLLRHTDLANNKVELLKLARLDSKVQLRVVKMTLKHDVLSVDEAVKDFTVKKRVRQLEKKRKTLLTNSDSVNLPDHITLHHGDCRDMFPDIVKSIKKKSPKADILVVTDPPYNIKFKGYKQYTDNMPDDEYIDMMTMFEGLPCAIVQYPEQMMSLIYPALGMPDEVLCWCYNTNMSKAFRLVNIYKRKPNFNKVKQPYKNPNDRRVKKRIQHGSAGAKLYDWWSDIQLEKNVSNNKCHHPCQVPISLMERLIILLAKKNTIIVDPYAGVGTTGMACRLTGHKFIGIEVDEEYYRLAKSRLVKG